MKLRRLNEKDAPLMLEWMHDPDISENFQFPFAQMTPQKVLAFIRQSEITAMDARHYAVASDDDMYLGTVSLKAIDMTAKKAEYAICMRKSSMGTGAATFATGEILRIAFTELSLNRVYLNVLSRNQRAVRFYEKCGFIREGEWIESLCIRGELLDETWFRILKSEWKSMPLYQSIRGE